MWIDHLTTSRTTQALALAAQFTGQRQRVLAENVANIDTPDYQTRRVDVGGFQQALAAALAEQRPGDPRPLKLRDSAQIAQTCAGDVVLRPAVEPAANTLFHDGTNARAEQLLADVSANALAYEMTTELLRGKFDALIRAIRGNVA